MTKFSSINAPWIFSLGKYRSAPPIKKGSESKVILIGRDNSLNSILVIDKYSLFKFNF